MNSLLAFQIWYYQVWNSASGLLTTGKIPISQSSANPFVNGFANPFGNGFGNRYPPFQQLKDLGKWEIVIRPFQDWQSSTFGNRIKNWHKTFSRTWRIKSMGFQSCWNEFWTQQHTFDIRSWYRTNSTIWLVDFVNWKIEKWIINRRNWDIQKWWFSVQWKMMSPWDANEFMQPIYKKKTFRISSC